MTKYTEESLQLLRTMVRTPSVSFEEDAVCDLLCAQLSRWGIKFTRYGNNIVAMHDCGRAGAPTLVLDAHTDTVPPAASYTRDPYDPGDAQEVIYGLGSNDDGGSVVAMIAVFRYFLDRKLPFNLALALTCTEERAGAKGSQMLYGPGGPLHGIPGMEVIIGEPTEMKAATSERGLLVIDATAPGVTGHAARGNGDNAIYRAISDIAKLRAHKFEKVSPTMGEVKLSVTMINAGTAHNVIPDKCDFVIDIRPTDCYDNPEILAQLQAECESTLKARNLANKSSSSVPGSPLMRTVEALAVETYSSPTTSDWIKIYDSAVKMGPGKSERSHKADEFILVSEITDAVDKYIEFIERYEHFVE